jgi:hypothetical protein
MVLVVHVGLRPLRRVDDASRLTKVHSTSFRIGELLVERTPPDLAAA